MINNNILYLYSREYIYQQILMSNQTKDGVYWVKGLKELIIKTTEKNGYDDSKYTIQRSIFEEKKFYTMKDLYYFMNMYIDNNIHLDRFIDLNIQFNLINSDILNFDLNTKIDNHEYRLSEVIDIVLLHKLEYYYYI